MNTNHPLQSVYDKIPKIVCKGHCGRNRRDSCCGPIGCTALEARLLEAFDGQTTEWDSIGNGRVHMSMTALAPKGYTCPHLGWDGRCTAYEVRPMICRLWGVDENLPCPWGCKPERTLTREQSYKLLTEAERIADTTK